METQQVNTSEKDRNEEEVLTRSRADPEAFKSIYAKYFKRIFLFVLHRVEGIMECRYPATGFFFEGPHCPE